MTQEQLRLLQLGHKLGALETALFAMEQYAEQARRDAQHQAYVDNLKRSQARASQANAQAAPTAPDVVGPNDHFHPSHLRRPQPVQSVKDPFVTSPGATVRAGR